MYIPSSQARVLIDSACGELYEEPITFKGVCCDFEVAQSFSSLLPLLLLDGWLAGELQDTANAKERSAHIAAQENVALI
jgi:hypothetical protein